MIISNFILYCLGRCHFRVVAEKKEFFFINWLQQVCSMQYKNVLITSRSIFMFDRLFAFEV